MKYGTYPKPMLLKLMEDGYIQNGSIEAVNPGSLNLCLTGEMFRLNSFQHPQKGQSVWAMMKQVGFTMHHPSHPCEVGLHYVARLQERPNLSKGLYCMANPRSTTGRQFVHTRLLVDGDPRLDQIEKDYRGDLWALIRCLPFPEFFVEGDQLTQIRVFNKDTRITNLAKLKQEYERTPMFFDGNGPIPFNRLKIDREGSIYMTLNLFPENGPAAYVAKQTHRPAYFSRQNPKDDFFEAIEVNNGGKLSAKEHRFYIMTTIERVCLPNHITAEIVPIDERIIEARNNFAGFVDQGFNGEITCEVAVHEPIDLVHRQIIARLRLEYVIGDTYTDEYVGTYKGQSGPRLAKNFV